MQNVAAVVVVLDTVEQLIIRVFDQLGGRRLVGNAVDSFYRATQLCWRGLGSRNSVRLSVCLSVCHTRVL